MPPTTSPQTRRARQPPAVGVLKLNTDGANFPSGSGIRALIRDSFGMVVGALLRFIPQRYDPLVTECIALWEGLRFAQQHGFRTLAVESDSLIAISAITSSSCPLMIEAVVEEIKSLFTVFSCNTCTHFSRSCNSAAHMLAQESCSHCSSVAWLYECPNCVNGQIALESSLIH